MSATQARALAHYSSMAAQAALLQPARRGSPTPVERVAELRKAIRRLALAEVDESNLAGVYSRDERHAIAAELLAAQLNVERLLGELVHLL